MHTFTEKSPLNTKPPLPPKPGPKLRDCTMDKPPTTPRFCALPRTLLAASAKVRTLTSLEGPSCSQLPETCSLATCTAIKSLFCMTGFKYKQTIPSSPAPPTHNTRCASAACPYPDRPCVLQMPPRAARTFPLALLEPACTTEREIDWKLLAERFNYLPSSLSPVSATLQQLQTS